MDSAPVGTPQAVIATQALTKHYGKVQCSGRPDARRARRRDLRLPGTEWLRQVDHDPHPARLPPSDLGRRHRAGAGRDHRLGRHPRSDRLPARRNRAVRLAERRGRPRLPVRSPGLSAGRCARSCASGCRCPPACCAARSATTRAGMRQKIGVIQALQHDPELAILDEPSEGLDPLMQQAFYGIMDDLRAQGRTVFLSSHVLSEVERICDRVAIIRAGHLMALQNVDELLARRKRRIQLRWRGSAPDLRRDPRPGRRGGQGRPDDAPPCSARCRRLRARHRLAIARGPDH